jgi:phosphomannomutase
VIPRSRAVESLPCEPDDVRMTHLATKEGAATVDEGSSRAILPEGLAAAARAWIECDPDPATRAELEALLAAGDGTALVERMGGPLRFGTAGIRGAVGAGPNRMNRAVVIRTTRGLADYLNKVRPDGGPVVVGFDGRLTSQAFAEDVVGVLAAAEIPVLYFEDAVPTPLVAYAARVLEATAAVVVTASHNPPSDNGYKVYDANAAQIIPPVDAEIAAAIDGVGPAMEVPRIARAMSGGSHLATPLGPSVADGFVRDLLSLHPTGPADRQVRIVYTPLHGVGGELTQWVLEDAGFDDLHVVAEQADPDGRFPTVAFPNPEEPGALDLALRLAARIGADLVLANDPDADRLAVCVADGEGWRTLTGNQVGQLLTDFVLEQWSRPERPLVVSTIVSSPMTASVAAARGARFDTTLTGFKWIANAGLALESAEGVRFAFGYEEALGYTVGPAVRDKDGIGAALWFAELAARCRAEGETVLDRLGRLYREHGLWASLQKGVVRVGSNGVAEIAAAMDSLSTRVPDALGGMEVTGVTDFRVGAGERPRWLPAAALVVFELGRAGRALVRPSGTEPRLKIYADVRAEVDAATDLAAAEAAVLDTARRVIADMAAFLGLG